MKKIITLSIAAITSLAASGAALAAGSNIPVNIPNPPIGSGGNTGSIGLVISNIITIIIIVAVIAVLFMLVFGAFEWITSGGDKDAVAKARGRIINALIGLVIIALAFLLVSVAGSIVGFSLTNFSIPCLTCNTGS